jgi:hypothetical protein
MNAAEAVVDIIRGLATIAEQRVYLLRWPEWPMTTPAVRVQRISGDPGRYHLRGGSRSGDARIQVDAITTDSYELCGVLADQINGDEAGGGLSGWHGSAGSPALEITGIMRINRSDMFEPDEKRYVRITQEYTVHYFD